VTIHALVAWLALGALTTALLYVVLLPLVRKLWRSVRQT